MSSIAEAVRRQLRDLQTRAPWVREVKFAAYNWGTRAAGLFVEDEFKLLARMAPCNLAIDVGGNWGQSVHALRRFARPERVVTFEPNPALADRLGRSVGGLAGVHIEPVALADCEGELELYVPRYRRFVYDGLASLDRESAAGWLDGDRLARFDPGLLQIDPYTVRVARLDDYGWAPDILKIDVQGLETEVARGALETIARSRPAMIVEAPSAEFVALVASSGLRPYRWEWRRLGRRRYLGQQHAVSGPRAQARPWPVKERLRLAAFLRRRTRR